MSKQFLNPPDLPDWREHFSQVVTIPVGPARFIYLSGQVGVDAAQKLAGTGDLEAQAEQAFKNLQTALAAAGATTADVVKVTIYVKNYRPADAAIISEVYGRYFPFENLPAATWVGVQSLAREEFLIEVDATAIVGQTGTGHG